MFIRLIDIDSLTDLSEVYDPLWTQQCIQLQKECAMNDSEIQTIEIGEYHTIAASNNNKLYTWGWNDSYQLGRSQVPKQFIYKHTSITIPQEFTRPKAIIAGDNHTLLLDYWGNLLVWGNNNKGQLGVEHCRNMTKLVGLEFAEKGDKIIDIKGKGNHSLAISENGKCYCWPFDFNGVDNTVNRPFELELPHKIQISTGSCGHNFVILLSKNGLAFSFGKDNQEGQLGLGDKFPRESPTLLENLKKEGERMTTVYCGFKHVVAKSSLGKIFTWGWGLKGQLGHGSYESEYLPRHVHLALAQGKPKVLQTHAGYKHTVILLETKKIYWWGTNGSMKNQCTPIECNLSSKVSTEFELFPYIICDRFQICA